MLLSWTFISSYTTIYFFVKNLFFSDAYISVNAIFECPCMFFGWERGHRLSTYATGEEMRRVIQYAYNCVHRGGGWHVSRVRTHLHYLVSCFWQHFCLIVSFFLRRNLTFIQKRSVRQKRLFFSSKVNFCRHNIRSFYLK